MLPRTRAVSAALLEDLKSRHVCIGDVRGAGYFLAMELVKDRDTKESFSDQESEQLLRGFLSNRLVEEGLICRAEDRAEPVIQLSPPLISTPAQLAEVAETLDRVLTEVDRRFRQPTPIRRSQPRQLPAVRAL